MRAGLVAHFAAALQHERNEQLALIRTDDFKEGIDASLQRREPRFTGR
jgi:enoyl-CoA hydratase/carnithine racemase